jgi:hypothetical protein
MGTVIDLREDRAAIEAMVRDSIQKYTGGNDESVGQFGVQFSALSGYVLTAIDPELAPSDGGEYVLEIPSFEHYEIIEVEFPKWEAAADDDDAKVITLDGETLDLDPDDDESFTAPFARALETIISGLIDGGVFGALNTKPGFAVGLEDTGGTCGRVWRVG